MVQQPEAVFSRRAIVRMLAWTVGLALVATSVQQPASAGERDKSLDIYFIDVEGGAATLIVTPRGESLLVDSGFPGNGDRDAKRIHRVARDVAGLKQIDHYLTTHWHRDHYGGIGALVELIPVAHFWDRGIPDSLAEDKNFPDQIAMYRRAAGDKRTEVHPGDTLPLHGVEGGPPLRLLAVAASGKVIGRAESDAANSHCKEHKPQPADPTDNARSIGLLLTLGEFQFLNLGDLTWNVEHDLVCPRNPIGEVDVFMVTHHGTESSNNPALVRAVNPRVAVMCNGPRKGGHPNSVASVRSAPDLKALFALHRNVATKPDQNAAPAFVANADEKCQGQCIRLSVAPDAKSYTVQIGSDGEPRRYVTK